MPWAAGRRQPIRGDPFKRGDDMLPMIRNRFATPTLFESMPEPWSDLRREIDRLFDSVMSGVQPAAFTGNER